METKKNVSFALIALLALSAANYSFCGDTDSHASVSHKPVQAAPRDFSGQAEIAPDEQVRVVEKIVRVDVPFLVTEVQLKADYAKEHGNYHAAKADRLALHDAVEKKHAEIEKLHADHAKLDNPSNFDNETLRRKQQHIDDDIKRLEEEKTAALRHENEWLNKANETKAKARHVGVEVKSAATAKDAKDAGDKAEDKESKSKASTPDSSTGDDSSWFPSFDDIKKDACAMTRVPYNVALTIAAFAATSPEVVELPAVVADNVRGAAVTGLVHAALTSRFSAIEVNSWVLMACHMAIGAAADTILDVQLPEDSNVSDDEDADVDYVNAAGVWAAKSAAAHAVAVAGKFAYGKVVGA